VITEKLSGVKVNKSTIQALLYQSFTNSSHNVRWYCL